MLRVFVAPVPMFAAVAIKEADAPSTVTNLHDNLAHYKCKPSDLPLYAPLHSLNKPVQCHTKKESTVRRNIESNIGVVREQVQSACKMVTDQVKTFEGYVGTAKAHTQSTIDVLNQPQNTLHRSGAIAVGGLAGFIFAARGGFIKKVLYTTIGAGAIASLCYPTQAEHMARDGLYEARKAYAIAYNFVKGVKPGDEVPIEPISKFPTSLQDIKTLAYDLYDDAKDVLFSKKK